jgi:SnoaL-like domain
VDAETVDYVAIRRLQDAYADIVTRRAWSELEEIFRPDVRMTLDLRTLEPLVLDGPGAIGEFIGTTIAGLDFFEFVVLNSVVQLGHGADADRAVARLYMNELRHDATSFQWTTVYGVYHDVHRRVDGRWWFAERRYHTLARTGPAVDAFAFPAADRWW